MIGWFGRVPKMGAGAEELMYQTPYPLFVEEELESLGRKGQATGLCKESSSVWPNHGGGFDATVCIAAKTCWAQGMHTAAHQSWSLVISVTFVVGCGHV